MKSEARKKKLGRLSPAASAARQVVTRRNGWKKGRMNCRWLQSQPVEHESQHEKYFVQQASLCPGVGRVEHQPGTLSLEAGKYTPDFGVYFPEAKAVVEVKMLDNLPAYIGKFNEAAEVLRSQGMNFYVLTEVEITARGRHKKARKLLRYAKSDISLEEQSRVLEALAERSRMLASDLAAAANVDIEVIRHMVARRHLHCEPELAVEHASEVSLTIEAENPLARFEAWFDVKPWTTQPIPALERRRAACRLRTRPQPVGPVLRSHRQLPEVSDLQTLAGGATAV